MQAVYIKMIATIHKQMQMLFALSMFYALVNTNTYILSNIYVQGRATT